MGNPSSGLEKKDGDGRSETARRILSDLGETKKYLIAHSDFYNNPEARDIYATLLTVEAAILFRSTQEFARLCVGWCHKKERETVDSN